MTTRNPPHQLSRGIQAVAALRFASRIGSHRVPFMSLKIIDKKMVLPGGTKDALKALPEFKYAS